MKAAAVARASVSPRACPMLREAPALTHTRSRAVSEAQSRRDEMRMPVRGGAIRRLAGAILAATLIGAAPARAADYVLGAEDVIQVSVWLHPELERSLTIRSDGAITLPPIGDIKAAGLTPKDLGDRIADRLSSYLRQTTTVTVTVTQYMSRSVYLQGAVAKPGRYGFETIPSLVDVLAQAGGALPGSNLAAVQVVRRDGETTRMIPADVAAVLRTGDASALPPLRAGDTIILPGSGASAAAAGDAVAVLGEVGRPGLYPVTEAADIWAVLAQAGGTTERGRLEDVRLLTRGNAGVTVSMVDLRQMLERGSRAPQLVRPGDVVVVMPRGTSFWNGLTTVLGLSRDALNVLLLVDYFQNKGSSTN